MLLLMVREEFYSDHPLPRNGINIVATESPMEIMAMLPASLEGAPICRMCKRFFFMRFDINRSLGTLCNPFLGAGNWGCANHGRYRGYHLVAVPRFGWYKTEYLSFMTKIHNIEQTHSLYHLSHSSPHHFLFSDLVIW